MVNGGKTLSTSERVNEIMDSFSCLKTGVVNNAKDSLGAVKILEEISDTQRTVLSHVYALIDEIENLKNTSPNGANQSDEQMEK